LYISYFLIFSQNNFCAPIACYFMLHLVVWCIKTLASKCPVSQLFRPHFCTEQDKYSCVVLLSHT